MEWDYKQKIIRLYLIIQRMESLVDGPGYHMLLQMVGACIAFSELDAAYLIGEGKGYVHVHVHVSCRLGWHFG